MIKIRKQDFLKGSLILMLSAAAAKVLGAVFKIPLTNMLGGVGMSYFSCAYSLFLPVYALTVTGISSAAARLTAQASALGLYGDVKRIRRVALAIFSAVGAVGSGLVFLLARPFSVFSAGGTEAAPAIAVIAPSVFFGCITAVERGCYEGLNDMYPTAVSQVIEGAVRVGAGLSLCSYALGQSDALAEYLPFAVDERALAAAAGMLGVTLSSAAAALFFALARLFTVRDKTGGECAQSTGDIARELLSTALPTGLGAVVTNLTAVIDMWTVIWCISHFGGYEAPVGTDASDVPQFVYGSFAGIAITVFNLVPSVTNMLGKGILPCVAEAWTSKDFSRLAERSEQALYTAAVIAVPAACGMGVLSGEVLGVLFPRQSDEVEICVGAFRYMMPGVVFLCVSFPLFSMLQAIGRAGTPLKIMSAGTIVKLAGNMLLIPVMGVEGAAVSTSVCYGVILAAAAFAYFRASGISVDYRPFVSLAYSGTMCAGAAWLTADICRRAGLGSIAVILAAAFFGGGAYFLSLWLSSGRNGLGVLKGAGGHGIH